ncbi:MAG: LamG-like jellyroll fold domain-containing protein [Nitrososphaera sp.]
MPDSISNALPISYGLLPREGNKAIPLVFDMITTTKTTIRATLQQRGIGIVQTLFIDNSNNSASATFTFAITRQVITVQAFRQGFFPVMIPRGDLDIMCETTGAVAITALLINVPVPPMTYDANPPQIGRQNAGISVGLAAGTPVVTRSITQKRKFRESITTRLGTDNADFISIKANSRRSSLFIASETTENIAYYIQFDISNLVVDKPSIIIKPNESIEIPDYTGDVFISSKNFAGGLSNTGTVILTETLYSFYDLEIISVIHKLVEASATDASSYVTSSISFLANRLYLFSVVSTRAAPINTPTVTGGGRTWTQVNTINIGNHRITMFRSLDAAATSGALTIDFAAQTQGEALWIMDELENTDITGINGANAIIQSVTNTSGFKHLIISFADFTNLNNISYGSMCRSNTAIVRPSQAFIELATTSIGVSRIQSEYKTGFKTEKGQKDIGWICENLANNAGIACEIGIPTTGIFDASNKMFGTHSFIGKARYRHRISKSDDIQGYSNTSLGGNGISFTWEMFFKVSGTLSTQRILVSANLNAPNVNVINLLILPNSNVLSLFIKRQIQTLVVDSSTTFGKTNIIDNIWHHVAVVSDGFITSMWIDGNLEFVVNMSFAVPGHIQFNIGCGQQFASPFSGNIDELAIWNEARYQAKFMPPAHQYTGQEVGLRALYHFDGNVFDSGPGMSEV